MGSRREKLNAISTDELFYACANRAAQLIRCRDKAFQQMMSDYPEMSDNEKRDIVNYYNKLTVALKEYDTLFSESSFWSQKIWNSLHKNGPQISSKDYVDFDNVPALTDPWFSSEERLKEWVSTAEEAKAAE